MSSYVTLHGNLPKPETSCSMIRFAKQTASGAGGLERGGCGLAGDAEGHHGAEHGEDAGAEEGEGIVAQNVAGDAAEVGGGGGSQLVGEEDPAEDGADERRRIPTTRTAPGPTGTSPAPPSSP